MTTGRHMTKGRIAAIAAGVAATAMLTGLADAQQRQVRIYNWSDYIDEEVLAQFEAETGIDVIYDVFDSNEVLESKLLSGNTGYDLVVPTADFLSRQIQAGVFQQLNKDLLPNLANMWDVVSSRTAAYDPDNSYSINYMWGTTGIGYNTAMIAERLGADYEVNSWALVFDPEIAAKLADCGIYWLDAPTEIIPAALNYLGLDPNTTNADDLAKAEELLQGVRETVRKFHSSEYINALANGDICVAFGWSGDIFIAQSRAEEAGNGVEIEYHIPKEGALMWFDQMAIPADAPNPDAAHKFINFMLDAHNAAAASNYVYYPNGNKASQEFLNEDVIGDPAIYPDDATMSNLYTVSPWDPKVNRSVTRLWTKIKSGV